MGEQADYLIEQGMLAELDGEYWDESCYWTGADGVTHIIQEMTDAHLLNIVRWAERKGIDDRLNPQLSTVYDEARERGLL